MSRGNTGRILAEELRRISHEIKNIDAQEEALQAQRRHLLAVAGRLRDILAREVGPRIAERLVAEAGVAPLRTRPLPRTGPRPDAPADGAGEGDPAPEPPAGTLPKGAGVRMIDGLYKGWSGYVRWVNAKGDRVTYTVTLVGPDGSRARTQVAAGSQGTKWEATSGDEAVVPPPARRPARKAATPRKAAPRPRVVADLSAALARGTAVRMLTGKFAGWEGVIATAAAKGSAITYAVNLRGPEGARGRTQVNQGSLGRTWQVADGAAPAPDAAAPAPVPGKIVRRRPAAVEAAPESSEAPEAPAAPGLPPGILAPQTPIRMLTGHFLGYTGVIATVQSRPGPRPDALYSVILTGPDGRIVRTSVRHSSLGRGWAKV